MFLRSLTLFVTLGLASACADQSTATIAAPSNPRSIVAGTPTDGLYPNVGALMFDFDQDGIEGDDEWCTGSLIAPTVFLTAAHCIVTPFTPPGSQFYVTFVPDLYAAKKNDFIKATNVVVHPRYGHDQANLNDLAVVFIPENATRGITPLKLPKAGELDRLAEQGALSKQLFVNVGYGTSSTLTGPPRFPYDGVKKYSFSEFMGLQPTWLGLLMNQHATGEGGDCYGDSGGPKFIKGDNTTIYATVTTGDFACRATTWDWRLDTPEARSFLGQFVKLP